jgi:hypothetical protein
MQKSDNLLQFTCLEWKTNNAEKGVNLSHLMYFLQETFHIWHFYVCGIMNIWHWYIHGNMKINHSLPQRDSVWVHLIKFPILTAAFINFGSHCCDKREATEFPDFINCCY